MITSDHYKIKEPPACSHCGHKMVKTVPPPYNVGDGLGWGVKYFRVCFNVECSFFVKGWEHMRENYGKTASYRSICLPDSGETDVVCVLSYDGLKGGIVEESEEES
ncbi:hypothetical protein BMS3Abin08_00946 [bacterium BMS3Abin08]|nr:hypothetical protein BMS3Abin08_00946 [bacterium BMS3Abin08]